MFHAEKVQQQLVAWIADYFQQNAPTHAKAVIGISGGKDSSVAAALCAKALGKDRVLGVLMPCGEQPDIDVSHDLCRHLGIPHLVINIQEPTDTLFAQLTHAKLVINEIAAINTPARIRMTVLYAVSGAVGGRVVCTGNLSEDWVGYSTKYGDNSGDFAPLSELTVTEVKAIGRTLGLPDRFIDKTPIDGLCGKSDEENLGFSYDALDRIIREGICEDTAIKDRVDRLHQISNHKRAPMPSFKLSPN